MHSLKTVNVNINKPVNINMANNNNCLKKRMLYNLRSRSIFNVNYEDSDDDKRITEQLDNQNMNVTCNDNSRKRKLYYLRNRTIFGNCDDSDGNCDENEQLCDKNVIKKFKKNDDEQLDGYVSNVNIQIGGDNDNDRLHQHMENHEVRY